MYLNFIFIIRKFHWTFDAFAPKTNPGGGKAFDPEIWASGCYKFCPDLLHPGSIEKAIVSRKFTNDMEDSANFVTFSNHPKTKFVQEIY